MLSKRPLGCSDLQAQSAEVPRGPCLLHKVMGESSRTVIRTEGTHWSLRYSAVPLYRGQFSHKYSQKTPHSSPVRARYGVSFMNPTSDWYSASVHVIVHVISYNIWVIWPRPRYNGTRLHVKYFYSHNFSKHISWIDILSSPCEISLKLRLHGTRQAARLRCDSRAAKMKHRNRTGGFTRRHAARSRRATAASPGGNLSLNL